MSGQENIWLLVILFLAIDLDGLKNLRVNFSQLFAMGAKICLNKWQVGKIRISVYLKYML